MVRSFVRVVVSVVQTGLCGVGGHAVPELEYRPAVYVQAQYVFHRLCQGQVAVVLLQELVGPGLEVFVPVLVYRDQEFAIRVPVPALLPRVVVVNGYHGPAPGSGHTGLDGVDPVLVGDAADPAVQAVAGDPGLFMEQEQADVHGATTGHGRRNAAGPQLQ